MDSRSLIAWGTLIVLLASSAAEAADRPCCCQQRRTLLLWPGQELEPDEEGPLETDRPDFTEASSVVGRGRAQLEFGYTYIEDEEGGTRVRTHSFPETLLRVGMLREWFEFRIAWNYGIERTRDVEGISTTISEPEDL